MGIPESVPAPELEAVENRTRFAHIQFDKMGKGRRYSDILVIKGSFDLLPERIELASAQSPVVLCDEWWPADASETASLKAAGDLVLHKPATDLLITGSARRSPADGPLPWTVGVVVRDTQRIRLNHQLELTGPRHWEHRRLGGWVLSPAAPAHEIALRYELAYGGAYIDPKSLLLEDEPQWIKHEANPSGRGYHNAPNPTGLTSGSVSDSSVNLSWTSGGGTTADYRISYQTGATAPATCAAGTTISESLIAGTTHSVTGLSSNTQYSFRLCAINGNATPDVSSGITYSVTTAYAAPPNVTGLTATPTSDTQINLSWTSGGGSTSGYRIAYVSGVSAPANCATGTQVGEGSITGTSHTISSLTAATQYSFRVCAIHANGTPDVSSGMTATATTLQAAPPNPTGLTATPGGTDSEVTLSWISGGGSTVDYRISYQSGGAAPATCRRR